MQSESQAGTRDSSHDDRPADEPCCHVVRDNGSAGQIGSSHVSVRCCKIDNTVRSSSNADSYSILIVLDGNVCSGNEARR